MSKRIFKGKLNPETPAKPKRRMIRVLVGSDVFKVSLVQPRYIPKGFGSRVIWKKRQIKLAEGDGYAPFAALQRAIEFVKELQQQATQITIDNRQHRLSIVPVVSPDNPGSPIGIEARGDGEPQKLVIRAGMNPLDTATAAAHLASTMWRMNAGKSSAGYPGRGYVKAGTTRYRLSISKRCKCGCTIDLERRIIRIEPGHALHVAARASYACNLAWKAENARRK